MAVEAVGRVADVADKVSSSSRFRSLRTVVRNAYSSRGVYDQSSQGGTPSNGSWEISVVASVVIQSASLTENFNVDPSESQASSQIHINTIT